MRQLITALAIALVSLAAVPPAAEGASTLTFVAVRVPGKDVVAARIYAGPDAIMTLSGHGWKSVETAQEVERRLNALAEEGIQADDISIWTERRTHSIMARGQRIVTIDKQVAAAQKSDRASLARVWSRNLREQFGRPYLSVPPVLVPVGENRAVPVSGNISGRLAVRSQDPFLEVSWDAAAKEIRVYGMEPGRTDLVVEDEASSLLVPARAAKYAARMTASVPAAVTGAPATPDVIARAVKAALGAALNVEPGASAGISAWAKPGGSLWPGKSAQVSAEVSASGPDYLSYRATSLVTVENEIVASRPADLLMVSNYPERLLGKGLWYEGKIGDWGSVRFLYHHVNGSAETADLVVELWNLGDQTARVQVIAGTAGPSSDEVWVGHRAAGAFLSNRALNQGWIAPIPPGRAVPLVSHHLRPRAIASGVLELRALTKADLSLRLYLSAPMMDRVPRPLDAYAPSPLLGQWQYPQPLRELKARYAVGGEWVFLTIGAQPSDGLRPGDRLPGNYGVIYDIDLELVNPTAEPARVALLLEPAGGPARGALLVDGRQVETALLKNMDEGLVARYLLDPGQSRRVRVQTMPQGGSNYPVRLVARPI